MRPRTIALALGLAPELTHAAIWTVDPSGGGDSTTIQGAIDLAEIGDTVEVLPGTYAEALDYEGKDLLVTSTGGSEVTTLEASGLPSWVVVFEHGETDASLLEGFTIRGANAGAILIQSSSPVFRDIILTLSGDPADPPMRLVSVSNGAATFEDCLFSSNQAEEGVVVAEASDVVLRDVLLEEQTALENAVVWATFSDLVAERVVAQDNPSQSVIGLQGAGSSARVVDSRFSGTEYGPALSVLYGSTLTVERSAFIGNGGSYRGGLYAAGLDSVLIDSSVFVDNTGGFYSGGGLTLYMNERSEVVDSLFVDNYREYGTGSAISVSDFDELLVEGSVFLSNTSIGPLTIGDGGGAVSVAWGRSAEIRDSIFTSNTYACDGGVGSALFLGTVSDVRVEDCLFEDNGAPGVLSVRASGTLGVLAWQPSDLPSASFALSRSDFISNQTGSCCGEGGLYLPGGIESDATIDDCLFSGNVGGALGGSLLGDLSVDGSRFLDNSDGIVDLSCSGTRSSSSLLWTHNVFDGNDDESGHGLMALSLDSCSATLENNTFADNSSGAPEGAIYLEAASGEEVTFRNNVVAWMDATSAVHGDGVSAELSWNDWYANTADVAGDLDPSLLLDHGNIAVEPGFFLFTRDGVGTNDALWLASTSPLRDAGDPSILDDDGSRSDIGAYGGVGAPIGVCDGDSDGHDAAACLGDDCDDADAAIHPGMKETWYDGIDANCDGLDDYDQDADGYRSPDRGGDDCDDTDSGIHPGMKETWYDGIDVNCDALDDYDQDLDGHRAEGWGDDCDDTNPSVHPDLEDAWYDGIDTNCDGLDDYDQDLDGHRAEGWGDDCDDTNPSVHPDLEDAWYDGVDTNCDGLDDYDQDLDGYPSSDWGGNDCDDADPSVHAGAKDAWYDGVDSNCDGLDDYDQDQDGHQSAAWGGDDCDDMRASARPGAEETWYDGVDSNCDGLDDYDQDQDGHRAEAWGDDCDDTDPRIHPGAPGWDERCEPLDEKTDGTECGCAATTSPAGSLLLLGLLAGVGVGRRRAGRK